MAKVVLANNWFGTDGARYRKAPNGGWTHISDDLVPNLPTSARVLEMDDGSEPPAFRPRPMEGFFSPFPIRSDLPAPAGQKKLDSRPDVEPTGETLRDFDELRGMDDAVYGKMTKAVEEKDKLDAAVAEKRRQALEKARLAKEAKRKAAKAAQKEAAE